MHSASISSCNSIILLYSNVFLFCILRNPNLQGIDFFFFSLTDLGICYRFFFVFGFGNLLLRGQKAEQRDERNEEWCEAYLLIYQRVIW